MRENRTHGSEGGEAPPSRPLSEVGTTGVTVWCLPLMQLTRQRGDCLVDQHGAALFIERRDNDLAGG